MLMFWRRSRAFYLVSRGRYLHGFSTINLADYYTSLRYLPLSHVHHLRSYCDHDMKKCVVSYVCKIEFPFMFLYIAISLCEDLSYNVSWCFIYGNIKEIHLYWLFSIIYMSWSLWCSMSWGERWLFILLILMELLNITI